jgi:hypothetical protein
MVNCDGFTTERIEVVLIDPNFAVIVVCPKPWPVATAEGTVATLVDEEVHAAAEVAFCVEPSLNVPIAEKSRVAAGTKSALAGETARELSVAEVTFTGTEAWRWFKLKELVAVIVTDPADRPFTKPFEVTVPIAVLEDVHVKYALRSCVVESLKVPIPDSWNFVVAGNDAFTGRRVSDCNVAPVTVNVVEPLAGVVALGSLIVAVIMLVPAEVPVI